ncbi:MAG: rod shape-determining protein MreC [Bacteroides sp.]|nr:rod shape-determining protein MreC [Lachnospiraceae bacterium]MCM1332519.1 rod shape-determining protein MreC [Bacteroides sp.]MCM1389799.1 rod shape-determining protein MreC [Bacteroides sp.]
MRDLLDFLFKYSKWLLFVIYVVASCVLLFRNNPYQHHIFLTSANSVSATVYGTAENVTSYFHLRDINDDLQSQNARLEAELLELQKRLGKYELEASFDSIMNDSVKLQYDFILADVISNSITRGHNYITIEKGSLDGIKPEMGVVDQNGVVGVVNVVGEHASRIISLLNPKMRLSCKIKGSEYFGSLVWDGKNPEEAVLEEMPRHEKFKKGDTIVTSGYSAVFPPGIPVGTIVSHAKEHDDNFYALRIKLFTDFNRLSTVRIITNDMVEELNEIKEGEEND